MAYLKNIMCDPSLAPSHLHAFHFLASCLGTGQRGLEPEG